MVKIDSIQVNGQNCPVLRTDRDLPVVTLYRHNGVVANTKSQAETLTYDGMTFWCPVDLIRPSVGEENIRKNPPTESEIDKIRKTLIVRRDIGVIKVVTDTTGQATFRILDGNTRYPLFIKECNPSHVFVQYCEMMDDELSIIEEQTISNIFSATTHESRAFVALKAVALADKKPKGEREKSLATLQAEAGGTAMFAKLCARAKNAIPELWVSLGKKEISIESLDWIAKLINMETEAILVALQKEVLASVIANKLSTSQVQSKVTAALGNWETAEEERKLLLSAPPTPPTPPTPVETLPDEAGTFAIPQGKGIQRPKGVPSTPNPSVQKPSVAAAPAPKAKVTAAQVKQQQIAAKSIKGKGGTKKPAPTAAKAFTNAPSVTIGAIAPDIKVEEAIVKIEPYQTLLDIEAALVKARLVNSNGSGVPKSSLIQMEKMALKDVDDTLVQIDIIDMMLTQLKSILSAVQMDLKDK